MGYMNVAALKHDQIDPSQHLDVPGDLYNQCCHSPFHYYPIAALRPEVVTDTLGDKADRRFLRTSHMGENGLYTGNSWHTSASGTLILTTDYFINLWGYQAFGDFPVKDQEREQELLALTGDILITKMAADYRKSLVKARASLKRNDYGHLTSTRKLVAHDPRVIGDLPEAVTPDADLTGFVWANYDLLHEDNKPDNEHMTGEQWQALIHEGRDKPPGFGSWREHDIPGYRSLGGPSTLGQQDVLIVQYSHLVAWHSVRLTRTRYTPAEALYPEHLRHSNSLGTALSMDYPLMREFFASQGVRIQL